MTRRTVCLPALLVALIAACAPAWSAPPSAADRKVLGWGLRVGVADDPDQALVGVQFDLGELAEQVRLRPDIQLGVGDDHVVLAFALPVHYQFRTRNEFTPYAGGGIVLGIVDRDRDPPKQDDTELEIALEVVGGLEWELRSGRAFAVELDLVIGDVHDAELLFGWRF